MWTKFRGMHIATLPQFHLEILNLHINVSKALKPKALNISSLSKLSTNLCEFAF